MLGRRRKGLPWDVEGKVNGGMEKERKEWDLEGKILRRGG
jgi:hypothetical protein